MSAREYLILDDAALLQQCAVDTYRSQGPGGQKRNKTSSAVRLRHRPTGLMVTAVEDRSQHVNRRRALRRLREAIALHVRAPVDPVRYSPTKGLATCLSTGGGLQVGKRDQRYCLAVNEVLDVVAACQNRVSTAAECIGISTSHLVKFLHKNPKLWAQVNQMRALAGLSALQ